MDTSWEEKGERAWQGAWNKKGRRMKEREEMNEKWVKTYC